MSTKSFTLQFQWLSVCSWPLMSKQFCLFCNLSFKIMSYLIYILKSIILKRLSLAWMSSHRPFGWSCSMLMGMPFRSLSLIFCQEKACRQMSISTHRQKAFFFCKEYAWHFFIRPLWVNSRIHWMIKQYCVLYHLYAPLMTWLKLLAIGYYGFPHNDLSDVVCREHSPPLNQKEQQL